MGFPDKNCFSTFLFPFYSCMKLKLNKKQTTEVLFLILPSWKVYYIHYPIRRPGTFLTIITLLWVPFTLVGWKLTNHRHVYIVVLEFETSQIHIKWDSFWIEGSGCLYVSVDIFYALLVCINVRIALVITGFLLGLKKLKPVWIF